MRTPSIMVMSTLKLTNDAFEVGIYKDICTFMEAFLLPVMKKDCHLF